MPLPPTFTLAYNVHGHDGKTRYRSRISIIPVTEKPSLSPCMKVIAAQYALAETRVVLDGIENLDFSQPP
jgi:hypothetical protein